MLVIITASGTVFLFFFVHLLNVHDLIIITSTEYALVDFFIGIFYDKLLPQANS